MKRLYALSFPLAFIFTITAGCESASKGFKEGFTGSPNSAMDSISTAADSSQKLPAETQNVTADSLVDLNLAPKIYNARVLSKPNPDAIHPDWRAAELGKAWSLFASKKISNATGVYYEGILISPRGEKMDHGPYFFFANEWE